MNEKIETIRGMLACDETKITVDEIGWGTNIVT